MTTSPSDAESPNPRPKPGPGPLMFKAPPRGPGRPSGTSTSTATEPSTSETSPSRPEEMSTPPAPDSSTSRPLVADVSDARPATSSDSPGSKRGEQLVAEDIRKVLVNATEAAHNGATDDVGRAFGQFRATEDELDEVSDAAAGLLRRRVPKGVGNPDIEDVIRAGIALFAYGRRQINIMRAARAARRKMASATEGQNGGETSA